MFIECLEKYRANRECLKHFRYYPPIVIASIQTKNGFVPSSKFTTAQYRWHWHPLPYCQCQGGRDSPT